MADGGNRLVGVEERFHELDRSGDGAESVRTHHASRQYQRFKLGPPALLKRKVDREMVTPLSGSPTSYNSGGGRNDQCLGPRLLQGLPWFGQFRLLEAVSNQDRYPQHSKAFHGSALGLLVFSLAFQSPTKALAELLIVLVYRF